VGENPVHNIIRVFGDRTGAKGWGGGCLGRRQIVDFFYLRLLVSREIRMFVQHIIYLYVITIFNLTIVDVHRNLVLLGLRCFEYFLNNVFLKSYQ